MMRRFMITSPTAARVQVVSGPIGDVDWARSGLPNNESTTVKVKTRRMAILQLETLGEEPCEHEQCGEHVLASHHPTDGFHVDREDCEAERHTHACSCAAGRAPKQEVEETDIDRVEEDVPEVIAKRIAEAIEAGVDRPTQVPHEKRLFAREISDEDFSEAREERIFVVEIRVLDEDTGVVESD